MANLISAEQLHVSFGLKTLLDNVSLGVQSGDRIGIVGLNGGGKTTLIEVLAGITPANSGRVSRANSLRMAIVSQRTKFSDSQTIADTVLAPLGVADFEWASNARVRDVFAGLDIADFDLATPVAQLSGGQRRRVFLAAALVQDLDLVILDEPTNHLDVEGVQWLAEYLLARNIAVVVVTHDRWFLDTVATTTWEVHDGQVDIYEGGYNDWIFARAERLRQADASEQRRQNLARKELAWLRRGAPARTSKPRYRIAAAEALIADVPEPRNTVELLSFAQQRLGKVVIDFEDATISTPDGRNLVENLTWRLAPGERIGIVGVNGSGKTTILKALAGAIEPTAGRRKEGRTVRLGWLRQELDDLDPNQRVLNSLEEIATYIQWGKKEISASQLAERLGFSPKRQRTPIKDLSGGERRRLQLARVLLTEPNVLLLDEPTNDLDIDTLQELESLLDQWAGTLVVVSHDRYFIERITENTYALFGDGQLRNLPGGIPQYLERRQQQLGQQDSGRPVAPTTKSAADASAPASGTTDSKPAASPKNNAAAHAAQKKMKAVERKLENIDAKITSLEMAMATAASAGDNDKLIELDSQLRELQQQHADLETEWLLLGEELEG
ncbi:MAG: ABC-F family ATP-binding cassette domain-containing protein [Corynebacterium sp.]|nr:ABC-F family ATP-binding cassette domain-containing protein [Corynebacterium sp.]